MQGPFPRSPWTAPCLRRQENLHSSSQRTTSSWRRHPTSTSTADARAAASSRSPRRSSAKVSPSKVAGRPGHLKLNRIPFPGGGGNGSLPALLEGAEKFAPSCASSLHCTLYFCLLASSSRSPPFFVTHPIRLAPPTTLREKVRDNETKTAKAGIRNLREGERVKEIDKVELRRTPRQHSFEICSL